MGTGIRLPYRLVMVVGGKKRYIPFFNKDCFRRTATIVGYNVKIILYVTTINGKRCYAPMTSLKSWHRLVTYVGSTRYSFVTDKDEPSYYDQFTLTLFIKEVQNTSTGLTDCYLGIGFVDPTNCVKWSLDITINGTTHVTRDYTDKSDILYYTVPQRVSTAHNANVTVDCNISKTTITATLTDNGNEPNPSDIDRQQFTIDDSV